MDGVIYHGNRLLPGAKEFVEWLYREEKEFLFLTNSSRYTPKELQKKLEWMGLDVDQSHFYTSALATAAFISTQTPEATAYAVGEHGLQNALYDAGITVNEIHPDYVIIGEADNYCYDHIVKATKFVNDGARLICVQHDLTGPVEGGIVPACRALMAPIELATGKQAYYGQTECPDDAYGTQDPWSAFRGCSHHRRPYGYRYCCGYRIRSGYGIGTVRGNSTGDDRGIPV